MKIIRDLEEARKYWSQLGTEGKLVIAITMGVSAISTISMIESAFFDIASRLTAVLEIYRELTAPLRRLFTVGVLSDERPLSQIEVDLFVTLLMFSGACCRAMAVVWESENRFWIAYMVFFPFLLTFGVFTVYWNVLTQPVDWFSVLWAAFLFGSAILLMAASIFVDAAIRRVFLIQLATLLLIVISVVSIFEGVSAAFG